MDSLGHKDNILYPWHRKVNLGLAWDTHQMWTVQDFEGDYADCSVPPTLEGTILRVSCSTKEVLPSDSLSQVVLYDPPPDQLTRGQLSRSYSYYYGKPVAFLRQKAPAGSRYATNETLTTHKTGCSPYDVDQTLPPPTSLEDGRRLYEQAKRSRPVKWCKSAPS